MTLAIPPQLETFEAPHAYEAAFELLGETPGGRHPTLGPGRKVRRQGEMEALEVPAEPFHASLGYGRAVSPGELTPEVLPGELEIIGADQRIQVRNTLGVPFRLICHLELFFTDPDDRTSYIQFVGSGTLVGPRHVLTAGHCLYDRIQGSRGTSATLQVAAVRANPGQNGSDRRLGHSHATALRYTNNWRASRDFRYDFGLITVAADLAASRPSVLGGAALGHWGNPQTGGGTVLSPINRPWLQAKPLAISGYPADKPSGTQWFSSGQVVNANPQAGPQLIYYDLDTCGGHSGSPVFLRYQQTHYLVGVHTGPCIQGSDCTPVSGTPCFPGGQRYSSNRGVHFSSDMLAQIRSWMGV